jgi:hypothetical protein
VRRLSLIAACLFATSALADSPTPEQLAAIDRDDKKAQADVAAKHGNKQSSEMSSEERSAMIAEQQAATSEVYAKYGVDGKEVARKEATLTKEERKQVQAEKERLDKEEADKKAAAAAKKDDKKDDKDDVEIVRGTGDDNPTELYNDPNAVEVDRPDENGVSSNITDVGGDNGSEPAGSNEGAGKH